MRSRPTDRAAQGTLREAQGGRFYQNSRVAFSWRSKRSNSPARRDRRGGGSAAGDRGIRSCAGTAVVGLRGTQPDLRPRRVLRLRCAQHERVSTGIRSHRKAPRQPATRTATTRMAWTSQPMPRHDIHSMRILATHAPSSPIHAPRSLANKTGARRRPFRR